MAANLVRYAAAERAQKPLALLVPPGPKRELLAGSGLAVGDPAADGVMLVDGGELTATNLLTPIDKDTFTWQSTARTLDGESLPNIPPVKVTRVKQ